MSKETKIQSFNPNSVGNLSNNIYGLPFTCDESEIVLIPVPWDVTVSYAAGTSKAPKAIFDASFQVDLYDPYVKEAWKIGIAMDEIPETIYQSSKKLREKAVEYIEFIANHGTDILNPKIKKNLQTINERSTLLNAIVKEKCSFYLNKNKLVGVIGGEHSVPLGLIHALAEKNDDFGILQIDAHADLRNAYEGFEFSHASIMFNALKLNQISKLVQVGIRDYCEEEVDLMNIIPHRIKTYFDKDIKNSIFNGKYWDDICNDIIKNLPDKVYISFDIDGLNQTYCPNTGTPVPGGLEYEESLYLIEKIALAGKKIIGFDLCEVGVGKNEWDCNVAARLLYRLSNIMAKSNNIAK